MDSVLSGSARCAIIHGDCLEILPTLADRSVAHVICDPPYTEHVHARMMSATTTRGIVARNVECDFAHLTDLSFVNELTRVASRWAMAFCAIEQLGAYKAAAPDTWIRSGIYRKQRAVPQFSGDRPGNACEGIAIFHRKGKKKWNGGGTHAFWEAMPADRADSGHPTAKPVELMIKLIELFSDPDDIILDPFAGSGTTGVAALRLGRRFIGLEKDEKYANIARERLEVESCGSTLQALRAGQTALFGAK